MIGRTGHEVQRQFLELQSSMEMIVATGNPLPFIPATHQFERMPRPKSPTMGWQMESTAAMDLCQEAVSLAAAHGHGPIF